MRIARIMSSALDSAFGITMSVALLFEEKPEMTAFGLCPRARARDSRSRIMMPAPSPRTNPSRFLSKGRLAWAASSLKLCESARMLLNPSACGQLVSSDPPTMTMSYSPEAISRAPAMMASALLVHAELMS